MIHDLFASPDLVSVPAAANDQKGDASLSQFFTPHWAAEELVDDALRGLGRVSVIEPSCGNGAFLSAIPKNLPAFGVDIDPRVHQAATSVSGREVLIGDFRTIDLGERSYDVVIGNPPFEMEIINGFLDRAHRDLPEDGLIAMVLPAYAFQTPSQVTRWMDMYSIDTNLIPRTLFPGLSKPLVWAKYVKQTRRTYRGFMLFAETRAIERMRPAVREALGRPGTWREAVTIALRALGGEGSLPAIYDAMAPERCGGEHWRPKVRQTLGRGGFVPKGDGRWSLPLAA